MDVASIFVTLLSCVLVGTVNSASVTVAEFCSCWSVQSTTVRRDSCTVVLDFGTCWSGSNTPVGVDTISDTDIVKFGLSIDNSVSKEWNCTVNNVCSLGFEISTLGNGRSFTAKITPECSSCNICNDTTTEFYKAVPTTTLPPTTPKRYKPLPHKYLFPTMLIGAIVCVIVAFIFVIRRWRQRIHHARKERASRAASFASLQAQTDNNIRRGDNSISPPQYGTTEHYNGGAHYLTISEKKGIVNDAFDYKN